MLKKYIEFIRTEKGLYSILVKGKFALSIKFASTHTGFFTYGPTPLYWFQPVKIPSNTGLSTMYGLPLPYIFLGLSIRHKQPTHQGEPKKKG